MSDYTDLRDELTRARAAREAAAAAFATARERLERLAGTRTARDRSFDRHNEDHRRERERLEERRRELEKEVERSRAALKDAQAVEARVRRDLERFTDPRTNIGRLSDATPILMMPVRLETRFKTVSVDNREQAQLWVRIYPDEC